MKSTSKCSINQTVKGRLKKAKKCVCCFCGWYCRFGRHFVDMSCSDHISD